MNLSNTIINEKINLPEIENSEVTLYLKREDLIHPLISGNKYRKLKYNIKEAMSQGSKTLLTFGGAYSNHIAAVACVGKEFGFKTIGVIRGDELHHKVLENPTLNLAKNNGMDFYFVTREEYRQKESPDFLKNLIEKFDSCYVIPEGGTNHLAIKGCTEILKNSDDQFDIVCCCAGTGGTAAGIIESLNFNQRMLVFSVLKGDFLIDEIYKYTSQSNWKLQTDYHFGGYAKVSKELIKFINHFKDKTGIPLDPVYTGKMMYGLVDLIKKGIFKKPTKILAIHTGGLQGIEGMNILLKKKKLPILV